jgi:hypothetical protein
MTGNGNNDKNFCTYFEKNDEMNKKSPLGLSVNSGL